MSETNLSLEIIVETYFLNMMLLYSDLPKATFESLKSTILLLQQRDLTAKDYMSHLIGQMIIFEKSIKGGQKRKILNLVAETIRNEKLAGFLDKYTRNEITLDQLETTLSELHQNKV